MSDSPFKCRPKLVYFGSIQQRFTTSMWPFPATPQFPEKLRERPRDLEMQEAGFFFFFSILLSCYSPVVLLAANLPVSSPVIRSHCHVLSRAGASNMMYPDTCQTDFMWPMFVYTGPNWRGRLHPLLWIFFVVEKNGFTAGRRTLNKPSTRRNHP